MTDPASRMRTIMNYKPPAKVQIPCKELKVGDLYYGDEVTKIHADEYFVHFYTMGKPYPQGFYPDYYIEVERKTK